LPKARLALKNIVCDSKMIVSPVVFASIPLQLSS